MWAIGLTAGLGLVGVAAIMAWKRRQVREFFERGFTLPEPGKYNPFVTWQPTYEGILVSRAPHPTLPGKAAYLVSRGRFVRAIDLTRSPPHWGIDIAAPIGTPVYAAKSGRVVRVGRRTGYGNVVEIGHGDGQSTLYAHLNQSVVRQGQQVTGGDVIGEVGRTSAGEDALAPEWGAVMGSHLHFEAHRTDPPIFTPMQERIDPLQWLQQQGIQQYGERY